MKYFILITCLWMVLTPFAQISNTREMLVKNHVLTSTESHCFLNSTGSCTVILEKYDERGNCIESDMARLGTLYRDVFDDNNKVIMSLQIDKSDTTHIDTIQYQFDQHNQLTQFAAGHDTTHYRNEYNHKGLLTRIIQESNDWQGNTMISTTIRTWTDFDKIDRDSIVVTWGDLSLKAEFDPSNNTGKIKYKYDEQHNLIKEVAFLNDTITQSITYQYDTHNRLIEKIDIDKARLQSRNRMDEGYPKAIQAFVTSYKYNDDGQIDELYTYYSDPCMSLDNHFLYKHRYLVNGLLDYVEVFEDGKPSFTIKFEYTFSN